MIKNKKVEDFKKAVIERLKENTDERFGSSNDLQIIFYEVFKEVGEFYGILCDDETVYVLDINPAMYESVERAFRKGLRSPAFPNDRREDLLNKAQCYVPVNGSGCEVYLFNNTIVYFERPRVLESTGKSVGYSSRLSSIINVYNNKIEESISDSICVSDITIVSRDKSEIDELVEFFKPVKFEENGSDKVLVATTSSFGIKDRPLWLPSVRGLDLEKNYNSDLPIEKIKNFVQNKSIGGLALFYGKPGTGKTTLIRYLLSLKDKNGKSLNFVLFNEALLSLSNTEAFLNYYLDQPAGSVFVLEDCEKILQSRDINPGNVNISALLDMTDGILGNAVNTKFICTFNTDISKVDSALLRKGRLRVKYEFDELSLEKTRLHIPDATEGMTLAEIYNIEDKNDFTEKRKKSIGFGG